MTPKGDISTAIENYDDNLYKHLPSYHNLQVNIR